MNKKERAAVTILNKMFRLAKVDMNFQRIMEYSQKHPHWFSEFTMTAKQETAWLKWSKDYLKKTFRWPKQTVDKEMGWIHLMWGLRVEG